MALLESLFGVVLSSRGFVTLYVPVGGVFVTILVAIIVFSLGLLVLFLLSGRKHRP